MSTIEERLTGSQDDHNTKITLSDAWKQIVASCFSFTLVIQVGISLSYSSVLLPQLNLSDSSIKVTTEEASWIASLVTLIIPVGSFVAGPLMDRYGRKSLSAFSGVPFAIAWLTIALAEDVTLIYVSRVFAGIGCGFSTVCLVYCSEITHPIYRPMLLGLNSVFVSLGILLTCTLGVLVPWRLQAYVYCLLSIITIFLHWPLPESPYWLSTRSKAEKSLRWLYKRPHVYETQLTLLLRERERRNQSSDTSRLKSFLEPIVYKPIILLVVIFLLQQLSGAYVIIFYAVDIFRKTKVQYEDFSVIMFGAIRFIMSFVSLLLSRVFGRRPLLFVSLTGMFMSCLFAFLLRHLNEEGTGVALCILVFVCFGALGFLGIPWTLIGELFPVKIKGVISGLMITVAYVFMFIIVKLFPILIEYFDLKYLFLIFAIDCLVAIIVVYRFLPETLGVRFCDIENYFR